MNRNGNAVKKFLKQRDEKRKRVIGNRDPRELGLFKSVPARRKFRKEITK